MTPLLSIRNLSKRYGAHQILKSISLDVHESEIIAVIGASGSGKTTLLRCINLLEDFDDGEILLDGVALGYRVDGGRRIRLKERERARQCARTGMVFQSFNLFPHLTALGNVMLGLVKAQGVEKTAARDHATGWLRRVGLADRLDHYPSQLSGGQQQRVAIARAFAMSPRLVLLDEITSALDPELVQEVLQTIKSLAAEGATMLVVTHEMRFARDISDRAVFMRAGEIADEGPARGFFSRPRSRHLKDFLRSAV